MSKFASKYQASTTVPTGTIRTTGRVVPTHEGGLGVERDAKSALFLLAVTNMVREDTFYEAAGERDNRFRGLVEQVAREDAGWVARFIPYLRLKMFTRSASIVAACEYLRAGGPNAASVIDSACQRADEPAEVIGYWHQTYGRRLPAALKRGVARAVNRLYAERSALRYDGREKPIRFGDVIELVHPNPRSEWQSDLFRYLLDVRHHPEQIRASLLRLPIIERARSLANLEVPARREFLLTNREAPKLLDEAGFSWERLSGWLDGPMDARAWAAIIPSMGYMALLRNLRNFDEAGIPAERRSYVKAKLAAPDEVAKSRQLPIRFYSAWKNLGSMDWGSMLESALQSSLANVPRLRGRTLVLVDASGSMLDAIAGRSTLNRAEVAAVFGTALALRAEAADLVAFNTRSVTVPFRAGDSVLRLAGHPVFHPSGGTQTWDAFRRHIAGHDRVVILTDEQAWPSWDNRAMPGTEEYPGTIYTFNLAGYAPAHGPSGSDRRYTFGGLSDAAFGMLGLLEEAKDGEWPF